MVWCGVVWCGVVWCEMTMKTKSKKPDDADSSMMYQTISSVVSPGGDIVVSLVFNNNLTLSLGTFQYLPHMRGGGNTLHRLVLYEDVGAAFLGYLHTSALDIFNVGWLLSPSPAVLRLSVRPNKYFSPVAV